MLLTLSQPGKTDFGFRPPHEYSPAAPPYSAPRYSPRPAQYERPDSALPVTNNYSMSTGHRGLPPPSAMTLPDPTHPPPITNQSQPLGAMPAPPNQWQGAEESMRNWLSTKAEEERRKQEEERTRQESLRLEQRRVEQSILRESMQGGVPPQMIPMIFAGIGGSNLVNASLEWLQQHQAQLQASTQQALEASHDIRRDSRVIQPPQPPYVAAQAQQPNQPPPAPLSHHQNTFPVYPTAPETARAPTGPTSAPRSAAHAGLSRLNTIDLNVQQAAAAPGSAHPGSSVPQQEQTSSPSIYFHHWVPPATQDSKTHPPPTPSSREPGSAHPSHVGEGDYRDSPRKRKATGGHQPNPPPSNTSPSFTAQTNTRRNLTGHARSRSNKSTEENAEASRQTPSRRDSVATSRPADTSRPGTQHGLPRSPPRDHR